MSIKSDLLKEINAKVQRKKELAKEISREKTLATWMAEFFNQLQEAREIDSAHYLSSIAVGNLSMKIRQLDPRASVNLRDQNSDDPKIEIRWSKFYAEKNNCEEVTVMDASSAYFQDAIERV